MESASCLEKWEIQEGKRGARQAQDVKGRLMGEKPLWKVRVVSKGRIIIGKILKIKEIFFP